MSEASAEQCGVQQAFDRSIMVLSNLCFLLPALAGLRLEHREWHSATKGWPGVMAVVSIYLTCAGVFFSACDMTASTCYMWCALSRYMLFAFDVAARTALLYTCAAYQMRTPAWYSYSVATVCLVALVLALWRALALVYWWQVASAVFILSVRMSNNDFDFKLDASFHVVCTLAFAVCCFGVAFFFQQNPLMLSYSTAVSSWALFASIATLSYMYIFQPSQPPLDAMPYELMEVNVHNEAHERTHSRSMSSPL